MSIIIVNDKKFERYISSDVIQSRIAELAKQITSDYHDIEVCFVTVLNGALFFTSDLLLNINSFHNYSIIITNQGMKYMFHFKMNLNLKMKNSI